MKEIITVKNLDIVTAKKLKQLSNSYIGYYHTLETIDRMRKACDGSSEGLCMAIEINSDCLGFSKGEINEAKLLLDAVYSHILQKMDVCNSEIQELLEDDA